MLEYREFPLSTALAYLLFFPVVSYFIFLVSGLISMDYFSGPTVDHFLLLGYGALAATLTIPLTGIALDWLRRPGAALYGGAIAPIAIGFVASLMGYPAELSPLLELIVVGSAFSGFAVFMMAWAVRLNRTIVVRFRGRVSSVFIILSLVLFIAYTKFGDIGLSLYLLEIPIPLLVALIGILVTFALKPWKQDQVPLAVRGHVMRYFTPMVALLAAHILWYFSTKMELAAGFSLNPSYESLAQHSGLGSYQVLFLALGVFVSGLLSDIRGRKTSFSVSVLLVGFLVIFGSVFYGYTDPGDLSTFWVAFNGIPLLIAERTVEGFIFGTCLFLIWTELGSAKTKGIRLSGVWIFFLGYMALFWVVDLGVWTSPSWLQVIGGQFSILLALIALYFSGHLPEIVGREVEMEELALDFDDSQVKSTVDAFLGDEDLQSIRSQVDILDATDELSDSDMSDILGEDVSKVLPLRRVPGIGSALESKLRKAGYESAVQLAGETAQRLAQKIDGLSQQRAEKILAAARETVQKAIKSSSS